MEDLNRFQHLLVVEEVEQEQSVQQQHQQEVVMVAQDLHILEQLMRVVVAEVVLVQVIQTMGWGDLAAAEMVEREMQHQPTEATAVQIQVAAEEAEAVLVRR
jgi:hypothetical protein